MADYSNMTHNPDVKGYMWEVYGKFSKLSPPEDWDVDDFNVLFKCVIAFSDRESPLIKEARDIDARWKMIFHDFQVEGAGKVVNEIRDYGTIYRGLTYSYFMLLHDLDFETWFSLKMHFHQMNALLQSDIMQADNIERAISVRSKVAETLPQIKEDIKQIEAVLFRDEYLQKLIADQALQDKIGGWAERFAKTPEWAA